MYDIRETKSLGITYEMRFIWRSKSYYSCFLILLSVSFVLLLFVMDLILKIMN